MIAPGRVATGAIPSGACFRSGSVTVTPAIGPSPVIGLSTPTAAGRSSPWGFAHVPTLTHECSSFGMAPGTAAVALPTSAAPIRATER